MLGGIRNTAVVLVPVFIGLLMTACGGPSEANIDATIEGEFTQFDRFKVWSVGNE